MEGNRFKPVPAEALATTSEVPTTTSEPVALNPNGATVFEGPQPFNLQETIQSIADAWDEGFYDHHTVR